MVNFLQFLFILIPIGNAEWYDWSIKFSANGKSVKCSHDPPLSVYSCFVEHNPKEHINYGVNDKQLQWIGTTSATVSAMVKVEKGVGKLYFLELSEVDTVGDVYLNGVKILSVDNMFAVQRVDVTNDVKDGENDLNIVLAPPVTEALNRAKLWAVTQPPSCPAAAQTNGQCNVNMLRKAGYCFSWDWGPSMPDSGIYAMPKLYPVAATKLVESRVQLFSKYKADSTVVRVDVLIISPSKPDSNRLGVTFNPLDERNSIITASAVSVGNALPLNNSDTFKSWILQVDFRLTSGADVQWWWPNGHGKPVLYNATILWEGQNDDAPQFQYKLFGFRTVQLIQDAMEDGGASFYFKINDKPIFMSGSNWIPSSSAVSDFSGYYVDNLKSAQRAGIKMLRVWGGGIYERDEFYNTADELGIMIWQDFMFACSTYQNGTNFLSSVEDEVHTQLWRIGTHPAIVVFAGNNENEAALATNWWSISEANKPYYYDQYRMLYINTIRSGVLSANMSRPFLSSSPTNGIDTERENWIATNPYDVKFGDVHYYDYQSDCLDWRTFPKTRFASEFGYQSWGLISSIQNVTTSSDRSIGSAWMEQRNHHGDGNKQIANFITAMFGEQSWMTKSDEKSFESFVYLSQIVQAVCTTSQAAFYRSRSGVNGTMGALYWQLNDVWTTVSWSSIDYSKKYKPLHYEISKVFTSPITLVTNHDVDDFLKVFVVSDADSVIWVELEIQSFLWNTLQMQDKAITTHIEVKPNGANLIQKSHVGFLLEELLCPFGQWDLCVFNIIIRPAENETRKFEAQESWFSPVPYKDITFFKQTDANVTANSCVVEDEAISIRVSTNFPQPFVWLDTTLSDGQWTQNNMMLLKEHTIVKWETRQTIKCEDFMARLRIFYPSKIFSNEKEDGKSGIGIYWWICLLLGCTFLILICQLVCCGDERGRARADSDRRPLHFGKSKPRVQKYA